MIKKVNRFITDSVRMTFNPDSIIHVTRIYKANEYKVAQLVKKASALHGEPEVYELKGSMFFTWELPEYHLEIHATYKRDGELVVLVSKFFE